MNMKKVKLSHDDVRVGNFIYHNEKDFVKVSDINGFVSHRISKFIPKGRFLSMALEEPDETKTQWLQAYATVLFNVLSCVPDKDFLDELNRSAVVCAERHRNLYNVKDDISREEDDAVLEDEKNNVKAMEELKDASENKKD